MKADRGQKQQVRGNASRRARASLGAQHTRKEEHNHHAKGKEESRREGEPRTGRQLAALHLSELAVVPQKLLPRIRRRFPEPQCVYISGSPWLPAGGR